MLDPTDALTILDPVSPELRRALQAVLAVGFGQVTLVVERGEVQRVVFSCSLKKQGLTDTTGCGNITIDNEI